MFGLIWSQVSQVPTRRCQQPFGKNRHYHGMSGTPEYHAFCAAKKRCNDPTHPDYANYGGRGIKFLFHTIQEWSAELGTRPEGKTAAGRSLYSVDRIDNNGHYTVNNIRWSTDEQQMKNRRCCK